MQEQDAAAAKQEKHTDLLVAKKLLWIIPVLLGLIGFFSNRSLSSIEQAQVDSAKAQVETNKQMAQLSSDVRVLDTRMQYSVLEQLKDLRERTEKLEKTVPTP